MMFGQLRVWDVFIPSPTPIPQWFTFDLGVKARLSRFKFHHQYNTAHYVAGDPKVMEVYGSNNPNPDGSWDSWILGTFESIKPSGLASGWTEEYTVCLLRWGGFRIS